MLRYLAHTHPVDARFPPELFYHQSLLLDLLEFSLMRKHDFLTLKIFVLGESSISVCVLLLRLADTGWITITGWDAIR